MARVQNSSNKQTTQHKSNQKQPVSKKELAKTNPRREATKNEIMFFRIGMSVIALTLVVLAIVLVIQYFTTEEEVGPYEDYIHITASDLRYITQDDGYGGYGDFSYFDGQVAYEDLRTVLNANDVVYVYFYRSSDVNLDIKTVIDGIEGIEDMAFLLLDLDLSANATLLETPEIAHLSLEAEKDNMFLIFDLYPTDAYFELYTRVDDILIELGRF